MLLYRNQNAGQNHNIKIANRSFENVNRLKYLGMTVTNLNLIQEEIKRRLNSGNASYRSVQNHLSFRLLFKNVKIRIYSYKTLILIVVLYGCESWSLILRQGHVARMGEKRNACRILVEKPEGKRPLGRPRHRGEDNIKMDFRQIGWSGTDCTDLAQDRDQWRAFVNTEINLRVP
jgi:hypothetical protein